MNENPIDVKFQQIQEEIKKILQNKPYNMSADEAQDWNDKMIVQSPNFTMQFINKPGNAGRNASELAKEIFNHLWNRSQSLQKEQNPNYETNPNVEIPNAISGDRGANQSESAQNDDTVNDTVNDTEDDENDSGPSAFRIFLRIINNEDLFFQKRKYLNMGNYYYFYYTDPIKDTMRTRQKLEGKESLIKAYSTLKQIEDKRLCYFWGVKDSQLEYGFLDNDSYIVYKVGKFKVTNAYIKNDLPKHQCMSYVRERMKEANIGNMKILHIIKGDLQKLWPETESEIKILDEYRIRKSYKKTQFEEKDVDENIMSQFINQFKNEHTWASKVSSWAMITEENIHFYFRILG